MGAGELGPECEAVETIVAAVLRRRYGLNCLDIRGAQELERDAARGLKTWMARERAVRGSNAQ